ncbi:hypothetical protein [Streptomyces luteoverticillatus]|nr:hypothetical protein [Streptomyces luteoverticillatus]
MHKPTFKRLVRQAGIDTPHWTVLRPGDAVDAALASAGLTYPVFVKPASGGAGLASGIARDEQQVRDIPTAAGELPYTEFVIEEYVPGGRDCTVGLVEFDGRFRTLPVLDVTTSREFYENQAKRDASLRTEHCPSVLPKDLTAGMGNWPGTCSG